MALTDLLNRLLPMRSATARNTPPRAALALAGAGQQRGGTGAQFTADPPKFDKVPPLRYGQYDIDNGASLDPTIYPEDLEDRPENPPETEQAKLDWINGSAARIHALRWRREQVWQLCRAYERGDAWYMIDNAQGLTDPRTPDEIANSYSVPLIRPIVQKLLAMLTQSKPDATPEPATQSDLDRQAATEGRAWAGYCSRLANDTTAQLQQSFHMLVMGGGYRYMKWGPKSPALVPVYNPDGTLRGARQRNIGNYEEDILPGECVLWDPSAMQRKDAGWVIVERVKPLLWVEKTYGEKAYGVKPDAYSNAWNWQAPYGLPGVGVNGISAVGNYMGSGTGISGDFTGRGTGKMDGVIIREYLELPNPKYPRGRMMVSAGGRIVFDDEWLYQKTDTFPLSVLEFVPDYTSPYGFGLVESLIDAQRTFNVEWTRILRRLDKDKLILLREQLAGGGSDLMEMYREARDIIEVWYKKGEMPAKIGDMPQINEQHFQMLDRAYQQIQNISGVVDILQGKAPSASSSGVLVELLQQQAAQQIQPCITSLEQEAVDRLEWRVALGAQFIREERMIGLDESGTPAELSGAVQQHHLVPNALRALTSGGQTDVICTPGSAIPKSSAGMRQEIEEHYQAGRLGGAPGSPEAVKNYWILSKNSPFSSQMLRLIQQAEEKAAQNPTPSPVDIQNAIEQGKAQAKTQGEIAKLKAQTDADVQKQVALWRAQRMIDREFGPLLGPLSLTGLPATNLAAAEKTGLDVHGAGMHLGVMSAADAVHGQAAYGTPIAPQPVDPMQQAQIEQQQNENNARLEVGKAAALRSLEPVPAPSAPPPDPEGDMRRKMMLAEHAADQKIRVAKATRKPESSKK